MKLISILLYTCLGFGIGLFVYMGVSLITIDPPPCNDSLYIAHQDELTKWANDTAWHRMQADTPTRVRWEMFSKYYLSGRVRYIDKPKKR